MALLAVPRQGASPEILEELKLCPSLGSRSPNIPVSILKIQHNS